MLVIGARTDAIGCVPQECHRIFRLKHRLPARLLQPGERKELLDHAQQPFGILPCIEQEFRLLGVERADGFLKEDMYCETDRCQRSL